MGKVPTISVNKTDGCHIYLSKDSLSCEIVSAKSSEMNVLVPGNDGDFVSVCVCVCDRERKRVSVCMRGLHIHLCVRVRKPVGVCPFSHGQRPSCPCVTHGWA